MSKTATIPKDGAYIEKTVLETYPEGGPDGGEKRRVEKTITRVVREPDRLSMIESGDTIYRDGEPSDEIVAVSDQVSESQGIHVEIETGSVISLSLFRTWLADDDRDFAIIGERSLEYAEFEGYDY